MRKLVIDGAKVTEPAELKDQKAKAAKPANKSRKAANK